MYVMPLQPAMVRRRRRTLGSGPTAGDSSFWSWGSATDYGSPAWYWAQAVQGGTTAANVIGLPVPVIPAAPATTVSQDNSGIDIPGSSFTDYLMNAATGHPTDSQIAYNTQTCVQAIQNMRNVLAAQGKPGPPVGAENQCTTDQQAYTKMIGGTANDLLANLKLPSPDAIQNWALLGLAGVIGLVIFLRQ